MYYLEKGPAEPKCNAPIQVTITKHPAPIHVTSITHPCKPRGNKSNTVICTFTVTLELAWITATLAWLIVAFRWLTAALAWLTIALAWLTVALAWLIVAFTWLTRQKEVSGLQLRRRFALSRCLRHCYSDTLSGSEPSPSHRASRIERCCAIPQHRNKIHIHSYPPSQLQWNSTYCSALIPIHVTTIT